MTRIARIEKRAANYPNDANLRDVRVIRGSALSLLWLIFASSAQLFAQTPDSSRPPHHNAKDGQMYVWIPAGSFQMGCSEGDKECYEDEKPAHPVQITKGFWIGQT